MESSMKNLVSGFLIACYILHDVHSYVEQDMAAMEGVANPMVHQLFNSWKLNEEWVRSNGQSGLRTIRSSLHGTKNYYSESHGNVKFANMHAHVTHKRTLALGELNMVMNGVQFSTAHLDYKPDMPHPSSNNYLATVEIPFPDVPQAVQDLSGDLPAQVAEMREWFKAWSNEDFSERDYRNHFKPVLCYLEGWFTTDTMDDLSDPAYDTNDGAFESTLWSELWQKTRFSAFSGFSPDREGYPFLPYTMLGIQNHNKTRNAQWNYRVACHPLKDYLPVSRLNLVDDLSARMSSKHTIDEYQKTLAARYSLNPQDSAEVDDTISEAGLLDELMGQIPGLDSYQGNLTDNSFDTNRYDYQTGNLLNTAYYHRFYKSLNQENGQIETRHRAFADLNLFFAMTSQARVSHMSVDDDCTVTDQTSTCAKTYTQKWSYALPLEIVYLTPLTKWNPFEIEEKGAADTTIGQTVKADGRNGNKNTAQAFDGVNDEQFYITPADFYTDYSSEAAKISDGKTKGVLDKNGNMQLTYASGIFNHMYYITSVGLVRQRFPIMPLNVEGSNVMKEIEAVKDIFMNPDKYKEIFDEMIPSSRSDKLYTIGFSNGVAAYDIPPHTHVIQVTAADEARFKAGQLVPLSTSVTYDHAHVFYAYPDTVNPDNLFELKRCDDKPSCFDLHPYTHRRIY